jgi:hypothetical protein
MTVEDGVASGDGSVTVSWVEPPAVPDPTSPEPAPSSPIPAPSCPSPVPALRVSPNEFSVRVAAFLIEHCRSTGRVAAAGGGRVLVVDPAPGGACPSWRAVAVPPTRTALVIAKHLLDRCRYSVRRPRGPALLVPDGFPR